MMTTSKSTELELARTIEADVFSKSSKLLVDDLDYIDQIAALYADIQRHYTDYGSITSSLTAEQAVFLQSVLTCRHQFVVGILTLLRGHHGDSFGYLRKSAEFTLFAARVLEKEGTAIKWLNAGSGPTYWNDYKDSFKINNMTHTNFERREKEWVNLVKDLPKLNIIIDQIYEESSKRLHATVLASGPVSGENGLEFSDSYVDLFTIEEPQRLIEPYFFVLWRHLDMLDVHSRVLLKQSGVGFNEAVWLAKFDPLERKINERLSWWRENLQRT
ncbi:MAG: hypothetical protein SFY67_10355 [Candidatus Melainabacteria bacterium]|nr:hypothetical protein [Candidatus Melainabacteria bacterium]